MLRMRDIMTTDVKAVTPETTLRQAMEMFAREHITGAPVVRGTTVLGVVSAADLLSFASTMQRTPANEEIEPVDPEWEPPVSLDDVGTEDLLLADAGWGAVTPDLTAQISGNDRAGWNELDEHDVSEVMTPQIWALTSNDFASSAAHLMRTHGIHRVLVVDDGILVGIVTTLDVARAVAEGRFIARTFIFNHDRDFAEG